MANFAQPHITNHELCFVMRNSTFAFTDYKEQQNVLCTFILSKFKLIEHFNKESKEVAELDQKIRSFLAHTITKYKKESCKFDQFIDSKKNSDFLRNNFQLPASMLQLIHSSSGGESPSESTDKEHQSLGHKSLPVSERPKDDFNEDSQVPHVKRKKVGRQSVPFEEKSRRGQQHASAQVRQQHEDGAITLAASQQNTPVGKLIRKANTPSGSTARLALSSISGGSTKEITKKTPEEALGFLLKNHLTKSQYLNLKTSSAESNADIWPNYNKVVEAKTLCRPGEISYQELSTLVTMQGLLNHTAKRILSPNPVITELTQTNQDLKLVFFFKFGLDGCGSFSTFHQKDSTGHIPDGSTLMVSQLVPLQIVVQGQPDVVVYKNKAPNSANSCRPIRLSYERETKDSIRMETRRLRNESDHLQPFVLSDKPKVTVFFKGLFTLIDGKVLLELTNCSASSSCPVCHKTFREISMPTGDFVPKEGSLDYGASILHFGLRSFECICHIGYRQDVKKSRVQLSQEEKELINRREKDVKSQFRSKLGLIVDQRRDGGAGNTTTGNVARKAFENAKITAEICGVPEKLVKNLGTLWGTLSCGLDVDPEKFGLLCTETKNIYFDHVAWFSMPQTLHKVLVHGSDLIRTCPIPIGLTNEEASEANNKFLRRFRLFHSRKVSWQKSVEDLYNRLMDVSDPLIQESITNSTSQRKTKRPLSTEILALLKVPKEPMTFFVSDDTSSDDSDND